MAAMPELDVWGWLLAVCVAFGVVLIVWIWGRRNETRRKSESMKELEAFWDEISWLARPSILANPGRAALEQIAAVMNGERKRLRPIEPVEPLLSFIAGEATEAPPAIVLGSFRAARQRIAKAHAAADDTVRTYVRAVAIDAYLARWIDLVASDGFAGVLADRDRLSGIDERGIDALLGAELALKTFIGDEAMAELGGALSQAAALVRANLRKAGVIVDEPRLLCPAELASSGFRAILEPTDSTRTCWIDAARAIIESDAFQKIVDNGVVVAVEQFGFKRDGRLIRPTRLCGYNPLEWRRN